MNRQRKLVVLLLAMTAVLAFSVTPVSAAPSPKFKPMTYVGIVESAAVPVNPDDQAEVNNALWYVEATKATGSNILKIILKDWNRTGDPDPKEIKAVCKTAEAMVANRMTALMINLKPKAIDWPAPGPAGDEGRKFFVETIKKFNDAFFGDSGCVSKLLLKVLWQPGNEPNIRTFCQTGIDAIDDDENKRHHECARRTVQLQQAVYSSVQQQEQLYGVEMVVLGAGLGSHHSPISFMHHVNNAMQFYSYKHAGMDLFAFHPYALRGSLDPISGLKLLPKVMSVVKVVLGKNLQFIYDEMGHETVTPAEKRDMNCTTPPSVMLIPEAHYPSWKRVDLKTSKVQGAVGYLNFLLADEKCENPGWQSGLYYWDRTPKPFLAEISKLIRFYTQSPVANTGSSTPGRPFG